MFRDLHSFRVHVIDVEGTVRCISAQESGTGSLFIFCWISPGVNSATLAKDEGVVFISDDLNRKLFVSTIAF